MSERKRRRRSASTSRSAMLGQYPPLRVGVALLLVAVLGWQIVLGVVSPMLVTAGRIDLAARLTPGSALVSYLFGRDALARGDLHASNTAFRASLARAPIDQSALTMLAIGEPQHTAAGMNQAAALGWRDVTTQRWLAEAAGNDATLFALRYDAYARQTDEGERAGELLDQRLGDPRVRAAIAARLALNPGWRGTYLGSLSRPDPALVRARMALLDDLRRTAAPASAQELTQFAAKLRFYKLEDEAKAVESGR